MLLCYMTSRPHEEEERLMLYPTAVLITAVNELPRARNSKPLLGVSDRAQLVQTLSNHPSVWENLVKRTDIPTASTATLVAEYNSLTGKSIKKFASRKAGEAAVAKLLPAEPKPTNGSAALDPRGRPQLDYTVCFVDGGTSKVRPTSKRGMVLAELRKRKQCKRSTLTAAVGFETAGYITKLIEVGHAAVVE